MYHTPHTHTHKHNLYSPRCGFSYSWLTSESNVVPRGSSLVSVGRQSFSSTRSAPRASASVCVFSSLLFLPVPSIYIYSPTQMLGLFVFAMRLLWRALSLKCIMAAPHQPKGSAINFIYIRVCRFCAARFLNAQASGDIWRMRWMGFWFVMLWARARSAAFTRTKILHNRRVWRS